MATVEEHLKKVKEELTKDPFNENLNEMLQNLYKIKAVGQVLEERVVTNTDSDPFSQGVIIEENESQ